MGIVVIGLFGLGIMASRSTNIERPNLVGLLTFLGAAVSAALLQHTVSLNGPSSWFQTIGIVLVGLAFYGGARLLDYFLGPVAVDREADEDMMGAHLSD
jgi:hypothetical protein